MSNTLVYTVLFVFLFLTEWGYIEFAERFKFVNYRKPENRRLAGYNQTIRGGGIIFVIATLVYVFYFSFKAYYFLIALFLLAIVSFLDDVINVNLKVRLMSHIIATLLLLYQFNLYYLPVFYLSFIIIFVIATINAYNFMDGINGMTGGYSLLILTTLYYINQNIVNFTSSEFLIIIGLSLLVFNFFNFRTRAKCFAGDVGSVSIAFIIVFLIGQLILKTQNVAYILLLLVYGIDSAFTVFFRKIRGENIFEAHRSHFYQYLTSHMKYSHLLVSSYYVITQLLINILVLLLVTTAVSSIYIMLLFFIVIFSYLFLRVRIEGKKQLFVDYTEQTN